jgi:phosphoserine phosphatase RsbU/P
MSALFLSVLLKMTGQLEARKGTPPDKILSLMAGELVPNIQSTDQASVFYGVIDRRGFELTYSGAGRSVALLFRDADDKLQKLESLNEPLTSHFHATPAASRIDLNPRDRLIICSEGALRAANQKGELFGEERLYRVVLGAPRLGVHELRNEIFYQIEKFTQGRDLPQDVTVIILEVKDRVIKLAKNVDQT